MKYSEYLKLFVGKKGKCTCNEGGTFFLVGVISNSMDTYRITSVYEDFVQLKQDNSLNGIVNVPINLLTLMEEH